LKRLARETFRQLDDLPAWDFVVMARPGAAGSRNDQIVASLSQHFETLIRKGPKVRG